MTHNLAIITPGSRQTVLDAAVAMGAAGLKKNFIPEIPELLASTPQVAQGMKYTLYFAVPEEPGRLPLYLHLSRSWINYAGNLCCSVTQPVKTHLFMNLEYMIQIIQKKLIISIYSLTYDTKNKSHSLGK